MTFQCPTTLFLSGAILQTIPIWFRSLGWNCWVSQRGGAAFLCLKRLFSLLVASIWLVASRRGPTQLLVRKTIWSVVQTIHDTDWTSLKLPTWYSKYSTRWTGNLMYFIFFDIPCPREKVLSYSYPKIRHKLFLPHFPIILYSHYRFHTTQSHE